MSLLHQFKSSLVSLLFKASCYVVYELSKRTEDNTRRQHVEFIFVRSLKANKNLQQTSLHKLCSLEINFTALI